MNKLFLVHCGFYDPEVGSGIYEGHVNFFIVAKDKHEARLKAKDLESYKKKRMHVDGMQEIEAVDGFRISLEKDPKLKGESLLHNTKHRDLAPKAPTE